LLIKEASEFTDALFSLAWKAHPSTDQNLIDDLVIDRLPDGHTDPEMKKHPFLSQAT
jgi:hypothetical protein